MTLRPRLFTARRMTGRPNGPFSDPYINHELSLGPLCCAIRTGSNLRSRDALFVGPITPLTFPWRKCNSVSRVFIDVEQIVSLALTLGVVECRPLSQTVLEVDAAAVDVSAESPT